MTDRDQQLRLLRHLSKEKLAWYGGRPGAQAPQLPQVGVPDASSAPNATATSTGGTLAAQATNRAAESSANIQQNLSDKMQPLKQVGEPVKPASQPTARNRNDRMARQVTQPPAGKTSLAHVVSPAELAKTAQHPLWGRVRRAMADVPAPPAQSVQVAETAVDAVRPKPTLWQSLVGSGPGMPPRTPRSNPNELAKDPAGLVRQYQRADITGRGPGTKAADPSAMAGDLKMMGFPHSPPERLFRRGLAAVARPLNQVPMPPTTPLGPDVSRIRQAGQDFVRQLPLIGPALGGPGLLRNADGTISKSKSFLAAGGAAAAGYNADLHHSVRQLVSPAPAPAKRAPTLAEMTPEERRKVIESL